MSMNVTRGDFVLDYVVASPRPPRTVPGRLVMAAMAVVLLLAVAATIRGGVAGDAQGDAAADVLMQGP